jgi:hypothetical protein
MPIAALAGFGALADAILAVIVLLAIVGIAYLVQEFGQYIPLIGGWLVRQATRFLTAARNTLARFYDAEVWAIQTVVEAVIISITYPLGKILDVANVTVSALWWLRNVYVPRWTNYAISYAAQVATYAYAYALALYDQAISYASAVDRAVSAYALALYDQAISYASAVALAGYAYTLAWAQSLRADIGALEATVGADLAALTTFVGAEFALAEQYAQGLVQVAVGALEADIAATETRLAALIEAYAAAAVKDAITITDEVSAVALTDIWPHLVTDVDALLDAIPQALIDIRDDIAAIPRAIPGSLLDALAALGALAIPLLRYLRECGVPMCRDLHGLSDLFNDLNSAATDAAILGLVALAVADPHAASDLIVGTLGPVANAVTRVTEDLVGV